MSEEQMQDEEVPFMDEEVTVEEKPEEKPATPPQKAEAPKSVIGLNEKGLLDLKDANEEFRLADMMIASSAVPKVFTKPIQVMMAFQFLKRFEIDPVVGIRQCFIVNGLLSIWGELPLALLNRSNKLEWIKESVYDKNYLEITKENKNLGVEPWGATCVIKIVGKDPVERSFTKPDAERAGLWSKNIWKSYPGRMLQMRTRGWCIKDAAPEVISGVQIMEYDVNNMPDPKTGELMKDVNPTLEKIEAMMKKPEAEHGGTL